MFHYIIKIMLSYKCKDAGIDCGFKTTAETEEELMEIIAEHAGREHDMKSIPPDVMERIKKAIKKYHPD